MNYALIYKSLLISFVLIFIFHCAERDRINIFDPEAGIDTLNVSLFITRADNLVELAWFPPAEPDYEDINLYRKSDSETQYSGIASLSKTISSFKDTSTVFFNNYSYFLTLQGKDSESPPTRSVKVTPGPLSFWILDRFGLNMFRTTYDLQHTRLLKYAIWVPEDLAVDKVNKRVLVTYPQYRFAEIFDQESGKPISSFSSFTHPYGCVYEPDMGRFWLTDSSGYIYRINPVAGNAELVDQMILRPTQIANSDPFIYVIESGRDQIIFYNKSGNKAGVLKSVNSTTLRRPFFIEPVILTGDLFIIDQVEETRVLYRYNSQQNRMVQLFEDKNLKTVRFDPKSSSVWLSLDNNVNSSIMQLSAEGIRLKMLDGFSGILDFRYNPETSTLIVVDSGERVVKHVREDATLIGVFKKAIYPTKVLTE